MLYKKKIIEMNIFILTSVFILIFNTYFYKDELVALNLSSILVTFIFFFTELKEIRTKKIGILRYLFYFILLIRYLLIPFIKIILGDINENIIYKENKESLMLAIVLYYSEMFTVFITIKILELKKWNYKDIEFIKSRKCVKMFIYFSSIWFVIIIIKHKEIILDNIEFILFQKKLGDGTLDYISKKNNYSTIIFDYFRILFISVITEKCFFKYKKTFKIKYKILNYLILVLNIFFINGYSRQSILVYLIINLAIVRWIYDDKKMFKILLIVSMLLILLVTFIKMSNVNENFFEYAKSFTNNLTKNLEVYFGGMKNILKANEVGILLEGYNKLFIFKNDLFSYFPLLTRISDYNKTTIVYFNYTIYKHFIYQDQIVPMILQGYIYFGIYLSSLLSILYTIIILYLDKLVLKSENILEFILIIYLGFPLSIFMMTNNTIVFGALGIRSGIIIILIAIILLKKTKELK